jgi:hypothetical protein
MIDTKKELDKLGGAEKIPAKREDTIPSKFVETKYPKSIKRKYLLYENFGLGVEENYYAIKDSLVDMGFTDIEKIVDTFTASEQSGLFGTAQQRLSIQQGQVSQYLATIGKMVRELFQIVREIKLKEERETLYDKAKAGDDGAEKALKGVWIDFVDNGPGGLKASSVYGLSQQLGYTVLPDLFFAAPANIQQTDVSTYVSKELKDFNDKVKTALVRKLEQFVAWRDATAKEIRANKKFTIQYLRQHYNSIKLYIDWVKPYMKNVKRMGSDPEEQLSADIIGAFEGAVTEIEILAKKPGEPHNCILVSFRFRTRPIMHSTPDYSSKGPQHIGRMEMTLRGYVWTDEDIKTYKKIKMQEDFEMIKSIDSSLEEAMDYLGEDIKKYLESAGQKFGKESEVEVLATSLLKSGVSKTIDEAREKAKSMLEGSKKPEKGQSLFAPFTSMFSGLKELGDAFIPSHSETNKEIEKQKKIKSAKKDGAKDVSRDLKGLYIGYKKSRRFLVP